MRAIIINENKLDKILEETCKELELVKFHSNTGDRKIKRMLSDMHRRFNYVVCCMTDKIKKG